MVTLKSLHHLFCTLKERIHILTQSVLAVLTVSILFIFSCKDTVLAPADHLGQNQFAATLKGKLTLENQQEYSNTLVYLDSLYRGAGTDSTGSYTLQFTDSDSLLNGTFKIYYFLSDYGLDSAQYVLRAGKVKLDSLDVDQQGDLPTKQLHQLVLVEGSTDKQVYSIGDTIRFTATFTNVSDSTVKLFIPSFFGPLGYVDLYNDNYPPFTLSSCNPVDLDGHIDLPAVTGKYQGQVTRVIRDKYYCGNGAPLLVGKYIVTTEIFINGHLTEFFTNELDKFALTEWYRLARGNSPRLDLFPNKFNFPVVTIVE